ncbi:hypothetical protein PT974_07181 [Cladobotryum mycophilum]|uniref:Uncharacterized protein n=1 Tax=Cladobotryum mycophilum TaxID=491253 RepID=A0ABR0SNK3_9HYPO
MHFFSSLITLGSIASLAMASTQLDPEFLALSSRQTSGPVYECHANCGYTIQDSRQDGYCKDPKWLGYLDGCLNCALKYDIWKDYGTQVTAAAKACGLDATPKSAEQVAASSAGVPSSTVAGPTSTAAVKTTESSSVVTPVATSTTTTSSVPVSSVPASSVSFTSPHTNTTGTAGPTTVPVSAGSQLWKASVIVTGMVAFLVAGLM